MNDKTAYILARLETGFRTDADRLKQLEQYLATSLESARQLGESQGTHGDWDQISQSTRKMEGLMGRINTLFSSRDADRVPQGLSAWQGLQEEDDKLEHALAAILAKSAGLLPEARQAQSKIDLAIDENLNSIRGVIQAMRIKLELLKEYSDEDADLAVKDILGKLPNLVPNSVDDAETYLSEYRKAGEELKKEKHKYKGLGDVLKGIFMWVESPEERVEKNRADSVHKI